VNNSQWYLFVWLAILFSVDCDSSDNACITEFRPEARHSERTSLLPVLPGADLPFLPRVRLRSRHTLRPACRGSFVSEV
jgi:hypothetical protein